MKFLTTLLLLLPICAQEAPKASPGRIPPPTPPVVTGETVVAKIGGKAYSADAVRKLLSVLPKDAFDSLMSKPKDSIQSLLLMEYLEKEANKSNLPAQTPFKEQLAFQRTQILAQATVTRWQEEVKVTPAELKERYEKDKAKFEQAKIRAIFVAMSDPAKPAKAEPGKDAPKVLSEGEARDKAQSLLNQVRAGGDFAALARQHSDDTPTKEKGGEYGFVRRTDRISDTLKDAIFALKPGEVSDLIKQPNGFFIIKVDETKLMDFSDARTELELILKQEKYQDWIGGLQKQFEVSIENEDFFKANSSLQGIGITVTPVVK